MPTDGQTGRKTEKVKLIGLFFPLKRRKIQSKKEGRKKRRRKYTWKENFTDKKNNV